MAIKVIAPEIKKQYLDGNGDPYSGGKLYVYTAGTTTLVETYTDESGGTANANPIILNSNGEVGGLYLSAGSYKFRLDDSDDNTIWTVDNVTIRDFGDELDTNTAAIATINSTLEEDIGQTRIVSGEESTKSTRARFLVPHGSSNEATILATTTDLVMVIDGTSYTLDSDVSISGLNSAPSSNNTAAINDSLLSDQAYTKQLGSLDTFILIDTIGSEISALDGKIAAFAMGSEYILARVDNTNGCLREVRRGYFFDENGDAIPPDVITDGDILTLMSLGYLFLNKDLATTYVTYNEPHYSGTEPSNPQTGDFWYDLQEQKWKRYNSTTFIDAECVFIGSIITDSSGNTVGARAADYYADHKIDNTFELENFGTSATVIKSKSIHNNITVFGNKLNFLNSAITWNMANDFDSDETETASMDIYAYLKEDGSRVLSHLAPHNNLGSLKGYYHPHESWRYIGKVYQDSSKDFETYTVQNSPENLEINNKKFKSISADYRCSLFDRFIEVDANGGDKTLYLYPAALNPGGKITVKMANAASQNKVTVSGGFSTANILYAFEEILEYTSFGSSWKITSESRFISNTLIFTHTLASGNSGGAFTAGSWQTRVLNTTTGNAKFGALASNQITLQPGVYNIKCWAYAHQTDTHQIRLADITNTAYYYGAQANAGAGTTEMTRSDHEIEIDITAATVFELQHLATTTRAIDGFGVDGALGHPNIFCLVKIERLGLT